MRSCVARRPGYVWLSALFGLGACTGAITNVAGKGSVTLGSITVSLSHNLTQLEAGLDLSVSASGGMLPYAFILISAPSGATLDSQSGTFTQLPAGTYRVRVLDARSSEADLDFAVPLKVRPLSATLVKALSVSDPLDPNILNDARYDHTATRLNDGRVVIAGGYSGVSQLASVEIFDPSLRAGLGSIVPAASLSATREGHSATLLPDGRLLVAGGYLSGGGATNTTEIFNPTTGFWSAGPSMAQARAYFQAIALSNGKVLAIGGYTGSTNVSGVEIFDPTANSGAGAWTAAPSLSTGRSTFQALRLADGRVLVAGGYTTSVTATVEIFDPIANSGAGAWTAGPSLSGVRANGDIALLNDGHVVLAGGNRTTNTPISTVEIFDPTANAGAGAWSTGTSLLQARRYLTLSRLADGRLLAIGGQNGGNLATAEFFDSTANSGAGAWTAAPAMPTGVKEHTTTTLIDGRLLVAGGEVSSGYADTVMTFSPSANSGAGAWWKGQVATPRENAQAAVLADGRVLLIGGDSGSSLSTVEVFNPADASIQTAPSLSATRSAFTAITLPDGRVFAAGGYPGGTSTTELFDPAANQGAGAWSAGPNLITSRYGQTANLLPDGRVLLAGGYSSGRTAAVEIFNPSSNLMVAAPSLSVARNTHSATLLADGRVLVAGGFTASSGLTSSVEIFNPAANAGAGAWTAGPSLLAVRQQHGATLLPDHRVLVCGGWGGVSSTPLKTCELFDPSANGGAGAWSAAPSLSVQRSDPLQILLPDGRVLVAGGDIAGTPHSSTEIFDPTANGGAGAWSAGPSLVTSRYSAALALLQDGRVLIHGGYSASPQSETALISTYPTQSLTAQGGVAPYTFRLLSGLAFLTDGSSGAATLTPLGSGTIQVEAVDAQGLEGQIMNLQVSDGP